MPESDNPIPRLRPALHALREWLTATKTPYLVIRGIAVSLIARSRATFDVGAVVLTDENSLASFLRIGEQYGFIARRADPISVAQQSRMLLLVHEPSGTDVDISHGALPFEKESIARGVPFNADGVELRVPAVEDLIIMKAVASRSIDFADIETLMTKHPDFDRRRVLRWVRDFAATVEMPEMLERLQNTFARHRPPRTSRSRRKKR